MISVTVKRTPPGKITGFICSGHAGSAQRGFDIVCAGVSSLTLTMALALEQILHLRLKVEQNAENGFFDCSWDNESNRFEETELLMKVMLLGLKEIQKQYPDYLKVFEVEVSRDDQV